MTKQRETRQSLSNMFTEENCGSLRAIKNMIGSSFNEAKEAQFEVVSCIEEKSSSKLDVKFRDQEQFESLIPAHLTEISITLFRHDFTSSAFLMLRVSSSCCTAICSRRDILRECVIEYYAIMKTYCVQHNRTSSVKLQRLLYLKQEHFFNSSIFL